MTSSSPRPSWRARPEAAWARRSSVARWSRIEFSIARGQRLEPLDVAAEERARLGVAEGGELGLGLDLLVERLDEQRREVRRAGHFAPFICEYSAPARPRPPPSISDWLTCWFAISL